MPIKTKLHWHFSFLLETQYKFKPDTSWKQIQKRQSVKKKNVKKVQALDVIHSYSGQYSKNVQQFDG